MQVFVMIQGKCFELLENWKYQLLMTFCVVINVGTLASSHFGPSREWLMVTWWINFICMLLFVIEMVVRIIFDWRKYVFNADTQFDGLLTVLAVLEVFLFPRLNLELGLGSLRMFRLIRIGNRFVYAALCVYQVWYCMYVLLDTYRQQI
jgi:hypothetical protein